MLWLWHRLAAAADSTPSLGTSICPGRSPKKTKKIKIIHRRLNPLGHQRTHRLCFNEGVSGSPLHPSPQVQAKEMLREVGGLA